MTKKEFLAIVYVINEFRHYITGYDVFVHIDHFVIKFLMNKSITSGRVTRWLLLLQEFNITIINNPGKENLVAYFLSWLTHDGGNIPVNDDFSDEHLFAIAVKMPWFVDIDNYLVTCNIPVHLPKHEKRIIIQQSVNYSWEGNDLFRTGPDLIIRKCVR